MYRHPDLCMYVSRLVCVVRLDVVHRLDPLTGLGIEPKEDADGGANSGCSDGSSEDGAPAEEEEDDERSGSRSLPLFFSFSTPSSHGRRAAPGTVNTGRGSTGEKKPSNPRIPAVLSAVS